MANLKNFQSYQYLCCKAGPGMVTAQADGDKACLRSAFLWEKPGLDIQQLEEENNILGSYRPSYLKTEHEVTESASAARQDEHILREKYETRS